MIFKESARFCCRYYLASAGCTGHSGDDAQEGVMDHGFTQAIGGTVRFQ